VNPNKAAPVRLGSGSQCASKHCGVLWNSQAVNVWGRVPAEESMNSDVAEEPEDSPTERQTCRSLDARVFRLSARIKRMGAGAARLAPQVRCPHPFS
jgi:hypothetical protein